MLLPLLLLLPEAEAGAEAMVVAAVVVEPEQ